MARGTVYNNIVSEEKWNAVNKDNKELLKEWLVYLTSVDRSHETISQYENDIRICFVWMLENANNKFFVDINKRDIMKFQNWMLTELKLSSGRIRRLKSTVSSLSNYIVNVLDDVYPDFKNIVNKIPAPVNEPVREKTVLADEEVEKVLQELFENKKYQLACVLALAAYSGSRKSELLRFKVSYFKDEYIKNGLYSTPEKIKTKGRGSAGKKLTRFVLAAPFKPYFDKWMEERKIKGIPDDIDDLFVVYQNEQWNPMKVSTLDNWTESLTKMFGKDFYFHCLRHYFCTSLYRANIPAEIIKEVIGWQSVQMVSTYTDIEASEEFDKYFDDDGIKK